MGLLLLTEGFQYLKQSTENSQHQHNIRPNNEMKTNWQLNLLPGLSLIYMITHQCFGALLCSTI